jgi:hypothetical protein
VNFNTSNTIWMTHHQFVSKKKKTNYPEPQKKKKQNNKNSLFSSPNQRHDPSHAKRKCQTQKKERKKDTERSSSL